MANEIKKELIQKKLDLVIQKLMHLGAPENEDTLKEGGEAIGFYSRDFGIKEWDWPQGIGLYGLLKSPRYRIRRNTAPSCMIGSRRTLRRVCLPAISTRLLRC